MLINPIEIRPIVIDIKIDTKFSSRYITPPQSEEIDERYLKYSDAKKLAKNIEIEKNIRHFFIINGTFIFGDFIEALIVEKNYLVKRMVISTLSMSQNNIDSLRNLIDGDFVQKLDLIISDYFFSHEKGDLIPYMYQELDIDNKFQLAAAGTHCKLCLIETECGKFIIIHGSANLRSSSNIEQFVVEENEQLYQFNLEFQENILEKYKTINHNIDSHFKKKSLRGNKLWQVVQAEKEKNNA
jgi:hypothetical protein